MLRYFGYLRISGLCATCARVCVYILLFKKILPFDYIDLIEKVSITWVFFKIIVGSSFILFATTTWERIIILNLVICLADFPLTQTKIVDFFRIQRSSQSTEKPSPGKKHLLVAFSVLLLGMWVLHSVLALSSPPRL